jgi:tellurite resistance protein
VDDADLTRALAQLGLDRDNWRAVSLLPLIEVAWADGKIQPAERKLLIEVAGRHGIHPGSAFLKRWLGKRPARTDFLRARTLLLQLWGRAGPDEVRQPETLEQLLDLCLRIAEAAGGLFGILFTVEPAERECMAEIASSLQLGPALPPTVAKSWRPPRVPRTAAPPRPGPGSAAADEPTTIRPSPLARPVSNAEETTRIRPMRRARSPGPTPAPPSDPEATTRRLARPKKPPLHAVVSFDEEVTSPYLDVDAAEHAGSGVLDE